MTLFFQFETISIQVIPSKDLCFIFSNGRPIWGGNKDQLIKILEQI